MQDRQKDYVPRAAGLALGDSGSDVARLQAYLKKFGYLESPTMELFGIDRNRAAAREPDVDGAFDANTKRALESLQQFAGVPVTGRLDDATLRVLEMPRCGVPDSADFVLDSRKWDHLNISYRFIELSPDLQADTLRQGIREALGLWGAVCPLRFTEVAGGHADIVIRFIPGDHGDGNGFDGAGGVLAHAFFPPPNSGELAGDAHFDEDESWSVDMPASGTDLVTVAAHEFGHSLGLAHSQVGGALMFPYYGGANRVLQEDDIAGIRQLYGS